MDYDRTPYRELRELAANGDNEAASRIQRIDQTIAQLKQYCLWALEGDRTDILEPIRMGDWSQVITRRQAGRRHLELLFPYKLVFHLERRKRIEKYLYRNYEDDLLPGRMDLIAHALYIVLLNDDIIGNLAVDYKWTNQLREGKQKRRGLLLAAVANEIEKYLFCGTKSGRGAGEFHDEEGCIRIVPFIRDRRKPTGDPNIDVKYPKDKKSERAKGLLSERAWVRAEQEESIIRMGLYRAIDELSLSKEDLDILFIDQGDLTRLAEERGVKENTLSQRRVRLINKIRKKMLS